MKSEEMLAYGDLIAIDQFRLLHLQAVDQGAVSPTQVAQRETRAIGNYLAVSGGSRLVWDGDIVGWCPTNSHSNIGKVKLDAGLLPFNYH